jgi:hypothetical protein
LGRVREQATALQDALQALTLEIGPYLPAGARFRLLAPRPRDGR